MSTTITHGIDNEDSSFNQSSASSIQSSTAQSALHDRTSIEFSTYMLSHNVPSPERHGDQEVTTLNSAGKGKSPTQPVPIGDSSVIHDIFDISPPISSSRPSFSSSSIAMSSSSYTSLSSPPSLFFDQSNISFDASERSPLISDGEISRNGKDKEEPPSLPPLMFTTSELGYSHVDWLPASYTSSTPGPSSYGSNHSIQRQRSIDLAPATHKVSEGVNVHIGPSHTLPTRRHSLTCLATHSDPSTTSLSMNKIKMKLGNSRMPSNLARKLLGKRDSPSPNIEEIVDTNSQSMQIGCLPPWYISAKSGESTAIQKSTTWSPPTRHLLKGKGRSNSSPLPISALDFVPVACTDVFQPLPLQILDYFDHVLPKELRINILRLLINIHELDHQKSVAEGRWSVAKASSSRGIWVGRDKGIRELFRLSRVSKSWQSLVFDGQLWTDLDLTSFPGLPPSIISRLINTGGSFIRSLNIAGHVHLNPSSLTDITDNLCLVAPDMSCTFTQLTVINLQGCTALTTQSLHYLLIRSRAVQELSLKGLGAVTNSTCDVLASSCHNLTSLNMSRCLNMDADGIKSLAASAIARGDHLKLKVLRLSGLRHTTDSMMRTLGKATPHLTVLDLSYARQLHNSALEAFVACDDDDYENLGVPTQVLSAHQVGRDSGDYNKYRRRTTSLRHLNLSFCILLTDTACSNLAYSVPKLEFLEMAGIGSDLKDDGLVRLLSTTPHIRRLDLEDAMDITDAVLTAITPLPDVPDASADKQTPEPGYALEHLIISCSQNVSDNALFSLIRACTKLVVLEADNTRMGSSVLRGFVKLCRQRKAVGSRIVAIDCRGIGEGLVRELSGMTRPRKGWRSYAARSLGYLDARDEIEEDLKIGQDECDETLVVAKTFYSWQIVDAVRNAREKRRKSTTRRGTGSNDLNEYAGRTTRWWSPGSRRSGNNSPLDSPDLDNDSCRTM